MQRDRMWRNSSQFGLLFAVWRNLVTSWRLYMLWANFLCVNLAKLCETLAKFRPKHLVTLLECSTGCQTQRCHSMTFASKSGFNWSRNVRTIFFIRNKNRPTSKLKSSIQWSNVVIRQKFYLLGL